MILKHDSLYKARFIKPISNDTILVQKAYEVHPPKMIIKIRGIGDQQGQMEWIKNCFYHYENRLTIANPTPMSSRRQAGLPKYHADIILDNNIGIASLVMARADYVH